MNANPHRSIQQHYFTREREGVFRTNEGFDTVAVSPGLDPAFIKNALHPYCFYKGPRDLPESGDGPSEAAYPAALSVYHADNGDLVIGQTVYTSSDFTGQRSAFFTHQYVVPSERKDEWLRHPERLFALGGFATSYDIAQGKSLPEIHDPSAVYGHSEAGKRVETDRLLARFGLTQEVFEQLLASLMVSVTNRRKVYVVLDAEAAQAEPDARQLMRLLFDCLPYAFRRRLGVLTFAGEPEGKQHIHVTFLEKGALRQADRQLERDMLFELPAGKTTGAESAGTARRLLDTIWTLRKEPERLQELFAFCEEALLGQDAVQSLSLPAYDELSVLFGIEQGEDALYDADRVGVWKALGVYSSGPGAGRGKPRLRELLVRLLRLETADVKRIADRAQIEAMLGCEACLERGERALLCRALALYVLRAAAGGDIRAAAPLLEPVQQRPETFRAVFRELCGLSPRTAERCATFALERAEGARALQTVLTFWLAYAGALPVTFLAGETLTAVKRLLGKESPARKTETASALFRFFDELAEREGLQRYVDYGELMKLEIQLGLLEEVPLSELGADDLVRLGFMLDPPAPELLPHLTKGHRLTLELWAAVYRVMTLERGGEAQAEAWLAKLGPLELERAQAFLRSAWDDGLSRSVFSRIAFGFYQGGDGVSGSRGSYDFDSLLDYLAAQGGKETVYDFIEWSAAEERFPGARGGIDPHYRAALNRYFDRYDKGAMRQKQVRQRLMAVPNAAFAALFRDIRQRQAPAWQRFALRRKKSTLLAAIVGTAALITLLLAWKPVVAFFIEPIPELQVDELPERTTSGIVTLKAQATDGYDRSPGIYINGELAGKSSVSRDIVLSSGSNVITVRAENKYGGSSEPVQKTIVLESPIGPKLPAAPPSGINSGGR